MINLNKQSKTTFTTQFYKIIKNRLFYCIINGIISTIVFSYVVYLTYHYDLIFFQEYGPNLIFFYIIPAGWFIVGVLISLGFIITARFLQFFVRKSYYYFGLLFSFLFCISFYYFLYNDQEFFYRDYDSISNETKIVEVSNNEVSFLDYVVYLTNNRKFVKMSRRGTISTLIYYHDKPTDIEAIYLSKLKFETIIFVCLDFFLFAIGSMFAIFAYKMYQKEYCLNCKKEIKRKELFSFNFYELENLYFFFVDNKNNAQRFFDKINEYKELESNFVLRKDRLVKMGVTDSREHDINMVCYMLYCSYGCNAQIDFSYKSDVDEDMNIEYTAELSSSLMRIDLEFDYTLLLR